MAKTKVTFAVEYNLDYKKVKTDIGYDCAGTVKRMPGEIKFTFREDHSDPKTAYGTFQPGTQPDYIIKAIIEAIRKTDA